MLLNLIAIEPSLGDLIFKNSDAKTTININSTCKILNTMTKDEVNLHYIDHTITEIPMKFEELEKKWMFFKCTEEEYKADLLDLSNKITDDIKDDVIDIFIYNYHWYKHESSIACDMICDVYKCLAIQYKDFLTSINVVITEEDETDDYDW